MRSDLDFYKIIVENGYYSSINNLKFYLDHQLFKSIDFKGRTFLDIGGGNGLYAFCAIQRGAESAVVIEPEFDGSTTGVQLEFQKLKNELKISNAQMSSELLQDYSSHGDQFDIVLMRNSINHINEEACAHLHKDKLAQKQYAKTLSSLYSLTAPGAILIITDCARRNFFGDLGIVNPFAKSIEWHKHQQPEIWASILAEIGFGLDFIQWLSFNSLRVAGQLIQSNRLGAYFTHSAFVLRMHRLD